MQQIRTVISGTGSYIPNRIIKNSDFVKQVFFEKDQSLIDSPGEEIIRKFKDITGIGERRWAENNQNNSDLAAFAAEAAIKDAGIDRETIDQIIVAHNYGDVTKGSNQSDMVPSIAARVRHKLGIKNNQCVPYDVIFGCPGWIQGVIQADAFIRTGLAKRCLVIGTETLSRIVDVYDRDTMIFSDGAGAVILEANSEGTDSGIMATSNMSHTDEELDYLYFDKSNLPDSNSNTKYIKMLGRKVYEYSLNHVPDAMKIALDRSGEPIESVKKILIHQANEKMDAAIVQRFFRKYGLRPNIETVMPMSIAELGNSSVATVPTLYDMILKNQVPNHHIEKGDILLFASVGAGMNINSFVYKQ
ncbi:MAG: ketoacyl-ACP synthase III [Bacteroidales bacterium]|nr:ketoacyl-ACP synthase III [Bacteroidales bacterium]